MMIGESLLNVVFGILNALFLVLPDISWNVNTGAMDVFLDIVSVVGYMLPMGTVIIIVNMIVALITFRLVISIIKTIWQLLPLV